jgi:anaerobic magnesium-protoporphyrin IX monomethyl ester cyclase
MRVGLIYPPSPMLLEGRVMPPLGILFVGAYLEKFGHEVNVLDLTGVADWKADLPKLLDWQPDIIGFTSTTPQYPLTLAIRDYLRGTLGWSGPLIAGGIHVTSDPDGVLADGWDAQVVGEGELSAKQLVADVQAHSLRPRYQSPLVPNLDDLGHPARHLVDVRSYRYELDGRPVTTTFSQRGCIFRCAFCESPLAGGFQVRYHSVDWFEQEVRIAQGLGFEGLMCYDDELNVDTDRLLKICDRIAPYNMVFRGFFVASRSTPELLRAMKRAGFWEILVGFESGNAEILRNIHKPQTTDIMRRFARQAREAGIRWKAACIVGLPGETWATIEETDRMLTECKPDDVDFSILQIYPGSPIARNDAEYRSKGLSWDVDYHGLDRLWYKAGPTDYQRLVQVRTTGMSREELVLARNWLEFRHKAPEWLEKFHVKPPTDRVDADLDYVREWAHKLGETMS